MAQRRIIPGQIAQVETEASCLKNMHQTLAVICSGQDPPAMHLRNERKDRNVW